MNQFLIFDEHLPNEFLEETQMRLEIESDG